MMVRAAVLKMKDPRQIIRDMEKLDEMGEDLSVYVVGELALMWGFICECYYLGKNQWNYF